MKNSAVTFVLVFVINFSFGQGIISDIMNVETVSYKHSELNEKIITKYKLTLQEQKTSLEKDLAKLDKDYQENVSKYVEDFTEKLKEGEEKVVAMTKQITVSRVNSLTMTHRTAKKNRLQDFLNKMQIAVRSLPNSLRLGADTEVQSIADVHRQTLEDDYLAHLDTIKAFEEQMHLVITEGVYEPLN